MEKLVGITHQVLTVRFNGEEGINLNAMLQNVRQALLEGKKISIEYNDKIRIIEPAYWFIVGKFNYLIAYCYYRKGWRTFRISKILNYTMLDEPCEIEPILWHNVDHSAFGNPNAIRLIQTFSSNKKSEIEIPHNYSKSTSVCDNNGNSDTDRFIWIIAIAIIIFVMIILSRLSD